MHFRFPHGFLWGAASSACQIESACDAGGKQPTVFDYYSRIFEDKFGYSTPDTAADFYHRYESDIANMKELGLKSFRFSISWARIFSDITSEVNQDGIDYYNRVIDCLTEAGIEPFFDLFHCDLPMFVIDKGGAKNPQFIDWFADYARVCFESFGDRVKLWSTVNEPSINIYGAYATGSNGPFENDLRGGLLASQHMLLAHYKAIRIYRSMNCGGKIGAVNHFEPVYPKTLDERDIEAANRRRAFYSGWWIDPMMKGIYPPIITGMPYIAEHMPEDYARELTEAFEPMDFLGINYYGSPHAVYANDDKLFYKTYKDSKLPQDDYGFPFYPAGLYDSMVYLKEAYGNPVIYITENGIGVFPSGDPEKDRHDDYRIAYMREHIREVSRSQRAGVDIRGYYHWTIIDTYEGYAGGYKYIFGLLQVDWKTLERTPRDSFYYYKNIIANNTVD